MACTITSYIVIASSAPGGCALNVKANEAVRTIFGSRVFVSEAPNDAGLTVGAAWLVDQSLLSNFFSRADGGR